MVRKQFLAGALILAAVSASGVALSQTENSNVKPASAQLARDGAQLLAQGKAQAAIDSYETALAVDPRNGAAYVGLARVHETLGLPGKAIKYYREALTVDPNDLAALEGQGAALVSRGATARAQVNLARIRDICQSECASAKRLSAIIEKGPPQPQTAASAPMPAPKAN